MVSKGSTLYHCCSVDCRPGGRRGNTKQVVARWRHLVAFGFYESPGSPSSGDACGIAPLHCHGYPNGQQWRYICSLSPPFSFDQNVAKRP